MRNNHNLYYYGMWSRIKEALGMTIVLVGFILMFTIHWSFLPVCIITGTIIIIRAKADRFDYQRQSGTIIHGGDGWQR